MKILTLLAAFILPWTAAFLGLRALERRLGTSSHILRQLGTSYFLGLFALHAIVYLDSLLFGRVHTLPILALIALGIALTALLSDGRWWSGREQITALTRGAPARLTTVLLLCLLALTVSHLLMATLEASYRPIYPWDAWQTWMYRAKAWFFAGHIVEFTDTHAWLKSGEITFNAPGHDYPLFTSIMAFWAAIALGEWSETLVSLPVMLAGWALALSMYGHCREIGASSLTALAAAFMLVSVPLLGTHLALAGQADIWTVAFCGLGLIGVLRGLTESSGYQLASGLLFCACSVLVKSEGAVWLAAAVAICFIVYRPRLALLLTLIAGALLLAIMSLSEAGGAGDGGQLTIDLPFLGSITLSRFSILDDYWHHLFLLGSWNILWYLVLINACLVAVVGRGRLRLSVLGFYLTLLASQALIFGFTEHGRWAEDGTALNRLLLQPLPAWIFSLILVKERLSSFDRDRSKAGSSVGIAAIMALLLVAAGITGLFYLSGPQSQPRTFDATSRLFPVRGTATSDGDTVHITGYQGRIAILSSGITHIDARTMPMLAVTVEGEFAREARFFWRRGKSDEDVQSIRLGIAGQHRFDLSNVDGWEGRITEIGLMFYEDGQQGSAEISELALASPTLGNRIANTWSDWTTPEYWTQASVNWLEGGRHQQAVPLPAVAGAWLACALLVLQLLPGSRHSKQSAAVALALVAWLLVDTRWLVNSGAQLRRTIAHYSGNAPREALDMEQDAQLAAISRFLHAELQDEPVPLLITSSELALRFQVQRSKYWLLPHPAAAYIGRLVDIPSANADALVVLDTEALEGRARKPALWKHRLAIKRIFGTHAIRKTLLPANAGLVWRKREQKAKPAQQEHRMISG